MFSSDNQNTARMTGGCRHQDPNTFNWFDEDAKLVEQESQDLIDQQKQFMAVEASLEEWDEYVLGLTFEEATEALNGLKQYLSEVQPELFTELGWHSSGIYDAE